MDETQNSQPFKKIFIKILVGFTKFLMFIREILKYFFLILFIPIKFIAYLIFKNFLVNLYRLYRSIKNYLKTFFSPAKNKLIFLFSRRTLLHLFLIIIALLVTYNSIDVKEIQAEEFGKNTIISSLIKNESSETSGIIEETVSQEVSASPKIDYYNKKTAVASNSSSLNKDEEGSQLVTSESGSAIVNPKITSAGQIASEKEVQYYIVEGGDTISTIAEKFNISTNTILWENKLGPRDYIKPGDKLTILPLIGLSHQVQKGDTLEKIAKKYGVSQDEILEYNELADAQAIEEGEILIIPGGEMPEPPKTEYTSRTQFASSKIPASARVPPGSRLLWPTTNKKINQYARWGHMAIDIGGDYSSPIYAADSGRVETINKGRGYGNDIIINHGGGKKTLYAHLSKIFIRTGDNVEKGQTIGMMGCTGWCTGTHLHFEVTVNGSKVNPLSYL